MSKSKKKPNRSSAQKPSKKAFKKPDKKTVIIVAAAIAALIVIAGIAFAVNHAIEANASSSYYFTDNGGMCTLDIYTSDEAQTVTVNYGTRFAPDTTNDLMRDWVDGTSGTLHLEADMHYSLVFFKNVPREYKSIVEKKAIRNNTIDLPTK